MNFINDRKYAAFYGGAAVLLFSASAVLFRAGAKAEEETAALRARNDAAAAWTETNQEESRSPALRDEDFYGLAESSSKGDVLVTGVSEDPSEKTEHGRILQMTLDGRGSYRQLLALLDRVMEKEWISADVRHIRRNGNALDFTIVFRAYRGDSETGGAAERS